MSDSYCIYSIMKGYRVNAFEKKNSKRAYGPKYFNDGWASQRLQFSIIVKTSY